MARVSFELTFGGGQSTFIEPSLGRTLLIYIGYVKTSNLMTRHMIPIFPNGVFYYL